MDKKLLDALNNVSDAITLLAEMLDNKKNEAKTSTGQALQGGNLEKQLKSLDLGIKNLQKDTKEILKNQKTIIDLTSKQKDDKGDQVAGMVDPKKKKSIKDGVSMIVMIAVGIIAIGLAFKLIGDVDFGSVIALSIALPLVAIAFEKIAQMKDLKPKEMVGIVLVTVAISAAIMLSSLILRMVQPVGLFQLFTSIFIAAMFGAVSFGIGKLITGLAKSGLTMFQMAKVAIVLPIAMIAVSLAIAGSSLALRMVQPVGLFQLITAVFIAYAFGAIAGGVGKLISGMKELKNPAQAALIAASIPVLLVAIAFAIAGASLAFAMIQPIGLFQFFTAVMIAIAFIPISFAIPYLAKALAAIDIKKAILLPIMIVAIAAAIWLASMIFAEIPADKITFMLLFKVVMLSVALGIATAAIGAVFVGFDKFKVTPGSALKGGITMLIIAATIAASSLILALGDYTIYPKFSWILPVALSMVVFGAAIVTLGLVATSGIGALAILAGAAAVLVVAAAIVGTAAILGTGDYSNFPSLEWSTSVALSMAAFGLGILTLGTYVVGTLGLGGLAIAAGAEAVLVVAQSIVDSAAILKKGDFTGGPTKEWAEGISIAMGAFSPIYGMLMANAIFDLFGGGGVGPADFAEAIRTIAQAIVDAATFFNTATVAFIGGPKKEWAEGVGQAIGAFAPVYEVLAANSGWFKSGVSVEDMKKAIMTISQGIVDAATFFAANTAVFDPKKAPSKEWSDGVGGAIKAFAPVFDYLSKNTGWFKSGEKAIAELRNGILIICQSIVDASLRLANGNFAVRIDPEFVTNMKEQINAYMGVLDMAAKTMAEDGVFGSKSSALAKINQSIVSASHKISEGKFSARIDPAFLANIMLTMMMYADILRILPKGEGLFSGPFDPLHDFADALCEIADAYEYFAEKLGDLNSAIGELDMERIGALRTLTGGIILMSLMDSSQFEDMMDALEDKAEIFVETVNKLEGDKPAATEKSKPGVTSKGGGTTEVAVKAKTETSLSEVLAELKVISGIASSINTAAGSIQTHLESKDDKINFKPGT